ncbi:hypothetical protein [Minwuia sp. IMCC3060]|uniref:hypothetical protein n=1 Tax=Minwuia sp. IMCC3060 TaxID=3040675 RepID=UPI0024785B4A|nr:hypothetical protein [Minwuia sp. IMCC3060]
MDSFTLTRLQAADKFPATHIRRLEMRKILVSFVLLLGLVVAAPQMAFAQTAEQGRAALLAELEALGVSEADAAPEDLADAAAAAIAANPSLATVIVQAAVASQPASAPLIVGGIVASPVLPAAVSPGAVAAAAAVVVPEQSAQIVVAAATSSGASIESIVSEVAAATGQDEGDLAAAAAEVSGDDTESLNSGGEDESSSA